MTIPPSPIGNQATAHTREQHVHGDGAGASREFIPRVIAPEDEFVIGETVGFRPPTGVRFDLGYVVRTAYGNPRAAIVTAAVAGLILGILLKKCLPAAKNVVGGW